MKIIIVGAGNAGRQLAGRLCGERHSVVLIDSSTEALRHVEASLDAMTLCGSGSDPRILEQAGTEDADLFVAVTDRDEVNILACLLANAVGVPRKIARVGSEQFARAASKFNLENMGINLVINQKQACADEICRALALPGAVESFDLLGGKALVAGFVIAADSPILGFSPATLPNPELLAKLRIIALRRQGGLIIPRGDTAFEPGDCLYLVGEPDDVRAFSQWMNPTQTPFVKVIVAGGGDIGLATARALVNTGVEVVLLEQDEARALQCSGALDGALVLRADALSESALDEAGVVPRTAFVAVTGDDENNVMNCLMARKKGADFTITLIARTEYIPAVTSLALVDRIVSPFESISRGILHFLRSRDVRAAALLHDLPGELLDIDVGKEGKRIGQKLRDLRFPREAIVAVVVRDGAVVSATGDLAIEAGDRLLVFAAPSAVKRLQDFFK